MLILVAVTVTLVAQGGIFGKAENATTGTTKHSDKEQLISAMVGGVQTGGKFVMTDVTLPEGAKWITSKENVAEIASPSESGNWVMTQSGNKFYIDKYGNVLDDELNSLTPFAFTKGTMAAFTLNETFDVNKEWSQFGINNGDFYSVDETRLFECMTECDDNENYYVIINMVDVSSPDDERLIASYQYHFGEDLMVDEAGWYLTDGKEISKKINASEAIIFENIVIPDTISDSDITMLNTYLGDVFKFVN